MDSDERKRRAEQKKIEKSGKFPCAFGMDIELSKTAFTEYLRMRQEGMRRGHKCSSDPASYEEFLYRAAMMHHFLEDIHIHGEHGLYGSQRQAWNHWRRHMSKRMGLHPLKEEVRTEATCVFGGVDHATSYS